MRWAVIVIACILGVIALLFILVMLPLKVSVRFVRTRGHSVIRVWVGVLSGLIWVPVYRKVPRPKEEREEERAGAGEGEGENGTSVVAGWMSRAQALLRSLGDSGDGNAQQGDRGRAGRAGRSRWSGAGRGPLAPRRRHDVLRRIGRFFYAALRSTGLDVYRLRIRVELGSGEAATSAIGVGLAYALINTGLAAFPVPLRFPLERPEIRVTPRYDRAGLDASVDCILALTPGYIILRGIQIRRRRRRVSCPTTR